MKTLIRWFWEADDWWLGRVGFWANDFLVWLILLTCGPLFVLIWIYLMRTAP
jgi:hypothetical protein